MVNFCLFSVLFVGTYNKEKTLQITEFVGFDSFLSLTFVAKLWTWRESNPRPNKEIISFLHVYLRLSFRAQARPKPPTCALSFLFHPAYKAKRDYPRFSCISISNSLEATAFGKCPVPAPCAGIKPNLLYSIKQQERSYFRQLNCERRVLRAVRSRPYMLTYLFYPLSKPVSPSIKDDKSTNIQPISDLFIFKIQVFCRSIVS